MRHRPFEVTENGNGYGDTFDGDGHGGNFGDTAYSPSGDDEQATWLFANVPSMYEEYGDGP